MQGSQKSQRGLVWVLSAVALGMVAVVTALAMVTSRGEDPGYSPTLYADEPTDSVCGLGRVATQGSIGDPDAEWVEFNHMLIPTSQDYGPGVIPEDTDGEEFPHCFERSPQGVAFASSVFAAQIANPQYTSDDDIARLLVGEPDSVKEQAEGLASLRERFADADSVVSGLRLVEYADDKSEIQVAVTSFDGDKTWRTGILLHLVWEDGDWFLRGPTDDSPAVVMTELRDAVGFQPWQATDRNLKK